MKSSSKLTFTILVITILLLSAIQVGYAFQAITDNSGNNARVNQKMLMIFDDTGTEIKLVDLPSVSYTGSFNDWEVGYYDPHVSGKMMLKFPGASCVIRVWVEMQDICSWSAVERITLRFQGTDYVLFNDLSSNLAVSGQTNPQMITVLAANAEDMLDFSIDVTYSETLNFNPNNISNFMKSKVMFSMDNGDPIYSHLKITYKANGNFLEVYDNLFYGELITAPAQIPTKAGHVFAGWFKDEACTTEWNFASDRLDPTVPYDPSTGSGWRDYYGDGIMNMNLYAKFVPAS